MQNMKLKTNVKAGGITANHNETIVGQPKKGLAVRTNVKAGGISQNHNETVVRKTRLSR
jgi:hypothetical protein